MSIHVRRDQDLVAHQASPDCPCRPYERLVDIETGQRIYEHRISPDGPGLVVRLGRIDRKETRR